MCVFMCLGQSEDRRTWPKEKFWPFQCPPIRMLNCPHAFSDALSLPSTSSWNRQGHKHCTHTHQQTDCDFPIGLVISPGVGKNDYIYQLPSDADAKTHLTLCIHIGHLELLRSHVVCTYTTHAVFLFFFSMTSWCTRLRKTWHKTLFVFVDTDLLPAWKK